jgi:hypothetical protein
MVPGLPADLSARIRERAAGIPLYAVETVRMLLDRGLLVQEGGAYRTTGSMESLEVPESLHTSIVGSYTRAIDAFTSLARPFWLAVTRLELGEWLATHGRAAEATEQLTQARTTFDALGAAPWLERVDAAGAEAPAVATHAHR